MSEMFDGLDDPVGSELLQGQEEWQKALSHLKGLVQQTINSGFTPEQAHAMVAATFTLALARQEAEYRNQTPRSGGE